MYLGFENLRQLEEAHNLSALWNGNLLTETVLLDSSPRRKELNQTSLWAMGNRFISR